MTLVIKHQTREEMGSYLVCSGCGDTEPNEMTLIDCSGANLPWRRRESRWIRLCDACMALVGFRATKGIPTVTMSDSVLETVRRAGGDAICEQCRRPFKHHPTIHVGGTDQLFLNRLCDGSYVKL